MDVALDDGHDRPEDLLDIALADDPAQLVLALIISDERGRLLLVDIEALAYRLLVVVGPLLKFSPALIAASRHLGRLEIDIVHLAAPGARPPSRQALQKNVGVDVDQERELQRLA